MIRAAEAEAFHCPTCVGRKKPLGRILFQHRVPMFWQGKSLSICLKFKASLREPNALTQFNDMVQDGPKVFCRSGIAQQGLSVSQQDCRNMVLFCAKLGLKAQNT